MTLAYVYKITRNDDLAYIGITVNPKARFESHKKSPRFEAGIKKIEILEKCESYELAEVLEEKYISEYDTYYNGLNLTIDGKGKNKDSKFNTLGYKFSEKSKRKMSESAKKRGPNRKEVIHSESTKARWSEIRKGKSYGPTKLTEKDWLEIYDLYVNDKIQFEKSFVLKFVKKSQKEYYDSLNFSELRGGNGKPLTKETLYSNYFAEKYNVSQQAIRLILRKNGIMAERVVK